jgi:hypothetical protein
VWQSSEGFSQAFLAMLFSEMYSVASNRAFQLGDLLHVAPYLATSVLLRDAAIAFETKARDDAWTAANQIVSDLLSSRQYLLPDPVESNKLQRIHLIGHSRGAEVNAIVSELLAQHGYIVDQYTSLDGVGTDWPDVGSVLGDVDIAQMVVANHKTNYTVEEAIVPTIFRLEPGLIGIAEALEPGTASILLGQPLKAPDRAGEATPDQVPFIDKLIVGDGMTDPLDTSQPPDPHDKSRHTNITSIYRQSALPIAPNHYILENYLGDQLAHNGFPPDIDLGDLMDSSWLPPNFTGGSAPPDDFNDGSFERLATLMSDAASGDFSTITDPDVRAEIESLLGTESLMNAVWDVSGNVQLVQDGSNHVIEMSQTTDTSLGQRVVFGSSPQSLEFDLAVINAGLDERLEVDFNGQPLHSFNLGGLPAVGHYSVSLAGISAPDGEVSFRVVGPGATPATIRLDNLRIAHEAAVGGFNTLNMPHIGQPVLFEFGPSIVGASTPVSTAVEGVTATLSTTSSTGNSTLEGVTAQTIGLASGSGFLFREPEGVSGSTLRIDFDQPIAELRNLVFATSDDSVLGSKVSLDAYLGDQLVATLHERGQIDYGGRVPEGSFSLRQGMFDSLRLHVNAPDVSLAVGNFEVSVLPPGTRLPVISVEPIDADNLIRTTTVSITGQLQSLSDLVQTGIFNLDNHSPTGFPITLDSLASSGRFVIPLSGLSEGIHTLVIDAADEQGDTSEQTVTFTVDLTKPSVAVDPIGLSGLIGTSAVTGTGTVTDTTLVGDSVLFNLDNGDSISAPVVAASDGLSGTFAIALADLTPGPHMLTIQGFDKAGNSVVSTVPIIYDATPPTIAMTIGHDGFLNQTNPVLTGTVGDNYGVSDSITYSLDGAGAVAFALDRNSTLTEGGFAIATSGLAEGLHTIQINATDLVGNASSQTFSFVIDLTAPALVIDTIGTQGYTRQVPITGTLSDDRRIYGTIQYAFDGGSFTQQPVDPAGSDTQATFTIATTGLSDGPHMLTVIGEDQAGNTSQSSSSFIVGTHGPTVTSVTPQKTVIGPHNQVTITFAPDQIVADQVTRGASYLLQASGGDGVFGDANAFTIPLFDDEIAYNSTTRTVQINLPAPLAEDTYQLIIRGSGSSVIHDLAGNPFNNGVDDAHRFVILDLPALTREPKQTFTAGTQPVDTLLADVNGDGYSDVVAADLATGALTVAINNSGKEWKTVQNVDLGVGPVYGIASGDFNQDGKVDLLLQGASSVFLAQGDGTGKFTLAQTLTPATLGVPTGGRRIGLLAADVTGDGHLDAVILAPESNQVLIYPGTGKGTFANPQAFATGGKGPIDLALANFVGDAAPDLAIANQTSGTVTFLEGNGQGSFTLADTYTVSGLGPINALKTADFDRDGRNDLALSAGANVYVLMNTLQRIDVIPIVNGSFDDGLNGWTTDVAPGSAQSGGVQVIGGVAVFQEGDAGRVTLAQHLVIPAGATSLSFDLVSNGLDAPTPSFLPDAFEVSLLDAAGHSLLSSIGASLTAFANIGPGGATRLGNGVTLSGNRITLDLSSLLSSTEADLYLDLVASGPSHGSTVSVDNFDVSVPPTYFTQFIPGAQDGPFDTTRNIAVGDVDGDGRTDLIVVDSAGRLVVYSGDNQGGFARTAFDTTSLGSGPMALAVGKIVGDSSDDIAYSLFDSGKIVSPLRFPQQTDVSSMVSVSYYGTQYNRTTKTTSFYAKITNTSNAPLSGPIYLAIGNLTPSSVTVKNPDGTLSNGTPYFDVTSLAGGDSILSPGETTTPRVVSLYNPSNVRYSYATVVLAIPSGDLGSTGGGAITPATVTLGASQVDVGSKVSVTVRGGPGHLGDWVGLYAVGAPDQHYLGWCYMDGTRSGPSSTATSTTLTIQTPQVHGQYEFRMFAAGSFLRLGTSPALTVVGGDVNPPTAPQLNGLVTDTGESNHDGLTNDTTPSFSWQASTDASGILGYWWAVDNPTPEAGGSFTTSLRASAVVSGNGPHTFYVRAVDASPGANLSLVSSLPFVLNTNSPTVTGINPATGASLTSGPQFVEISFSEPMNRSAGHLGIGNLVLSGAGVGAAAIGSADWIDDRTARFGIVGQWGVGPVDLSLVSPAVQDRAGNSVIGFSSEFRLISSPAATLELAASQVNAGALIRVSVDHGPADPADRVGLYNAGAADDSPASWLYLNGTQNQPILGISSAVLTFQAPQTSGSYEFRLFSRGQRIATSATFVVTGVEIFLDFAGGFLPDLAGVVEVNGSTGLTHPGFSPYGGESTDAQIAEIVGDVQQDFAPFGVRVIRDDNWQTDPLFGQGDTVIMVGGNGEWVAGTNPVVTATSVRWVAGIAPWDLGNTATNVGFVFSAATASAFGTLGWPVNQFAQQVANTISHEVGHTFGLDHVTQLNGTNELMGTAATGTQIRGDGSFSTVVLPREHGGAYSSYAYLMNLFGGSAGDGSGNGNDDGTGGPDPLTFDVPRTRPIPAGPMGSFVIAPSPNQTRSDPGVSRLEIPTEFRKQAGHAFRRIEQRTTSERFGAAGRRRLVVNAGLERTKSVEPPVAGDDGAEGPWSHLFDELVASVTHQRRMNRPGFRWMS